MDRRSKQLIKNSSLTLAVKGGALLVTFISFPLYIDYFGNQTVLGIWFTIFSVFSWILFFDLGIVNGLRNNIVAALENDNQEEAKIIISSAYAITGIVVLFITLIGIFIIPYINWIGIFNTSSAINSNELLIKIVTYVFIAMMIQLFFRLVHPIYYALQKPAMPGLIILLSSVLLVIFLWVFRFNKLEEKLLAIAIASILTYNLPVIIANIVLFWKKLKKCRPNIFYANKNEALNILKLGSVFFLLQLMLMLIYRTNEFFISWLSNPADVVNYQIYNKPFSFVSSIFFIALTPVWSAVTSAYIRNDFLWIRTLLKRLQKISLFAIGAIFLMVFFLQYFVKLWLGTRAIQISYTYGIVFAFASGAFIWSTVVSSIVNGMGKLKIQAIYLGLGAIVNFPLAYIFVHIFHSWIGVVIANIFSLLPYCIVQTIKLKSWLITT